MEEDAVAEEHHKDYLPCYTKEEEVAAEGNGHPDGVDRRDDGDEADNYVVHDAVDCSDHNIHHPFDDHDHAVRDYERQ